MNPAEEMISAQNWQKVFELTEEILSSPAPDQQCGMIASYLAKAFRANVTIWLEAEAYRLPGTYENSQACARRKTSLMSKAISEGKVVTSQAKAGGGRFMAAVPLVAQKILLGAVQVERSTPFEADMPARLLRVVSPVALAMQATRQNEKNKWRIEQLSLIRSVSSQITNLTDLAELSRQVSRNICDTFRYYCVGIFTLEAEDGALHFQGSAHNVPGIAVEQSPYTSQVIQPGDGMIGYVAVSGTDLVACKVENEPHYRYLETLPETQSEIALPLVVADRVVGVLDVQSLEKNAFHEMDILVLKALADNIALAVESTRMVRDLRKRAEQLATISEVIRSLSTILNPDKLMDEIVQIIHSRFGFPFVTLLSVHPGRRKIIYLAGSTSNSQRLHEEGFAYDLDDPMGMIPWVARSGTTLIAPDVNAEPLYRITALTGRRTRSEMTVPLIFSGEVHGVLDLQADKLNAFAPEDRVLFEALGDSIAIIMRNARIYESERWRRQVAESLRDVAVLLSSEAGLEQILDSILTELEHNLPCDVSAIWLIEKDEAGENGVRLKAAAVHGAAAETIEQASQATPEATYIMKRALEVNEPIVRAVEEPMGPLGTASGFDHDYSALIAPLRAGDQTLGILSIAHHSKGRYGSEALSMTSTFASYAAVAIENNLLYNASQEQAWVSTVMLQISEAAQSLGTIDELLETVVRITPMLAGVQACSIFLYDPATHAFNFSAWYGLEPAAEAYFQQGPILQGNSPHFDQLLTDQAPLMIQLETGQAGQDTLGVLFPLTARAGLLGAVLVSPNAGQSRMQKEAFSEQQLAILQGIVHQTAVAVENIRLLDTKQEEAYVTAVLLQVAQAAVSLGSLDEILDSIVHILPIMIGVDASAFFLWDPQRKMHYPAMVHADSPTLEKAMRQRDFGPGEFPLLDSASSSDSFLVIPLEHPDRDDLCWNCAIQANQDWDYQQARNASPAVLMAFPLTIKGEYYGALLCRENRSPWEGFQRRLEIITGVAQQAALAVQDELLQQQMIERERLEKEIQVARQIQQTFLPGEMVSPPGWSMDIRWRTARQVGGDFYDYFMLPGNRLAMVVADVSDKGMPAALYMTVARTLIRASAREDDSPARILTRVNNLLLSDEQNSMFFTAIFAELSLDSGAIVYANAGHNLPVLRRTSGSVERLEKGGVALGAWEDITLVNRKLTLEAGDSLLLYTDGVTDTFSSGGEPFGEDRLHEVIRNNRCETAPAILDAVDQALLEYMGSTSPSDDITMLALMRLPGQATG